MKEKNLEKEKRMPEYKTLKEKHNLETNSIITTTDTNSIVMKFYDNDKFNPGILEDAQSAFMQLKQHVNITIDAYGNIPIELLAYILEVSNHCDLELNIHNDDKGYAFISHLKNTTNAFIKINFKGEIDGG